jgi:hypothetical protein
MQVYLNLCITMYYTILYSMDSLVSMRKRVSQQPSFYAIVPAEGTLRLMAIGWDMAGEAEESLAP